MVQPPIRFNSEAGVARIVFANAANRNAVDRTFVAAFAEATQACLDDPALRVITITAEGPAFSVGADINAMLNDPDGPSAFVRYLADEFHGSVLRLRAAPAPVVVGVQGVAAGGGFGLVCGADLAILSRSAVLTAAYTASGLTPDAGSTWFAQRSVGRQRAFDLLATNPRLSAENAHAAGIVARIVDDDALMSSVQGIVETLLKQPAGTPARLKKLLASSENASLAEQLALEAESIVQSVTNAEVIAMLRRFAK